MARPARQGTPVIGPETFAAGTIAVRGDEDATRRATSDLAS